MRRSINKTKTSNDGWFWTNLRIYTPFRALATVAAAATLTVGCGREGGMARSLDEVSYFTTNRPVEKRLGPPERLAAAVDALEELVADDRGFSPSARYTRLTETVRDEVVSTSRQFAVDRAKLESLGAEDALQRLTSIERTFERASADVEASFKEVSGSRPDEESLAKLRRALRALAPDDQGPALSSNLGFGEANGDPAPLTLGAGVTPAYGAPIPGSASSALPRTPEPADLAATPETRAAPGITKLANELDRDPVKIYEYVRNNIEFAPYMGVRKGAVQTLVERSGSAADQAALLIALLRASGVPARFVQGTVEMPVGQAANWLGLKDSQGSTLNAVPQILSAGGIPTTPVRVEGRLEKVRFQHFWAEAYVPQDAYRGNNEGLSAERWTPLDPSVKSVEFQEPTADAPLISDQDAASLADAFADTTQVQNGALVYDDFAGAKDAVDELLSSKLAALPDAVLESGGAAEHFLGKNVVKAQNTPYLPSSLPLKVLSVVNEYRSIPSALTSSVQVRISGGNPMTLPRDGEDGDSLSVARSTAELAGKRITITYAAASPEDQEIIDAYHGLFNAPAYAASLVPVVRIDGQVVGAGSQSVSGGYQQRLSITYKQPGFAPQVIENPLAVGSITALALDLGRKSEGEVKAKVQALRATMDRGDSTEANALTDARVGALLGLAGEYYFARNDSSDAAFARGVDARRAVSGALTATGLKTSYVAGFPVAVRLAGVEMDVDADNVAVVPLAGGAAAVDDYLTRTGMFASHSEGYILDQTFGGTNGVSTTRVMGEAAAQGIPIHTITPASAEVVLPRLTYDAGTMRGIREALDEGNDVVVPERAVSIGSWTGTGYVVSGETRRGFMITGGLSGGQNSSDPVISYMQHIACKLLELGMLLAIEGAVAGILFVGNLAIALAPALALAGAGFVGLIIVAIILVYAYIAYLLMNEEQQAYAENVAGEVWGAFYGVFGAYAHVCAPNPPGPPGPY